MPISLTRMSWCRSIPAEVSGLYQEYGRYNGKAEPMGFWHTGYIEFHEQSGVEKTWVLSPRQFSCSQCPAVYRDLEMLRQHRFEAHPMLRPVLFIGSREVGVQPLRLTAPITAAEVVTKQCDRCLIDGQSVAVDKLASSIASLRTGTHRVVLQCGEVSATFQLAFDISTETDLTGIDAEFRRLAQGRLLDPQSIEAFIQRSQPFSSGASYLDGLCSYLYGVLAKEGAQDLSLKYDDYEKKYAAASERLASYDRVLGRMVACLIEFHFNHFSEAVCMASKSRAGRVAARYAEWLTNSSLSPHSNEWPSANLENLLVDVHTDQILAWGARRFELLERELPEITRRAETVPSEYDRAKLRILRAEVLRSLGRKADAVIAAQAMRNLPAFEGWAEQFIKACGDLQ